MSQIKPKTKKLIYFDTDDLMRYEMNARIQNLSFSEYVRQAVASQPMPKSTKKKSFKEMKSFSGNNPFVYDKPEELSKLIDEELYG